MRWRWSSNWHDFTKCHWKVGGKRGTKNIVSERIGLHQLLLHHLYPFHKRRRGDTLRLVPWPSKSQIMGNDHPILNVSNTPTKMGVNHWRWTSIVQIRMEEKSTAYLLIQPSLLCWKMTFPLPSPLMILMFIALRLDPSESVRQESVPNKQETLQVFQAVRNVHTIIYTSTVLNCMSKPPNRRRSCQ